jgi:predicted  nucleic acid-binding Zn-ribbon protein
MNQGLRAFKTLFNASDTVFCSQCGRNLTRETNLPRLARLGCPQCGCKKFDYDISDPEKIAAIEKAMPHVCAS